MLYYLHLFSDQFTVLNLFGYFSFRVLGAGVTALFFCLLTGNWFIRWLTALKLGQPIRTQEEVNRLADLHGGKKGTPTMGGIMLVAAVVVSTLLWAQWSNRFVWAALFALGALGALGFWDDFLKVRKKNSAGVSERTKLAVQTGTALVVGAVLLMDPKTRAVATDFYVPSLKEALFHMAPWAALVWFVVVITGSSNAVNLTDGLDGLAAGCSAVTAMVLTVFAYISGSSKLAEHLLVPATAGAIELSVFSAALAGASLGFLWFNCHPAKVFMGDTGSLALGGAFGAVAICINQELLLLLAGGVFVIEALSVLVQRFYFKLTKRLTGQGQRIFAMAPIHHHFELKGLRETTVVVRFWILALFLAGLALLTLKVR